MSRTKAQTDVEINTYNKRFFDTYIDLLPIIVGWYKDEVWKLYKDEGIKNWQQFCTSKLSIDIPIPRLNRDGRKKVVKKLSESGLSTRAIAYVLNIGQTTVVEDLEKVSERKRSPQVPDQQQRPIPSDLDQEPAAKPGPVGNRKTPEIAQPIKKEPQPAPKLEESKPEPDHLEILGKQVKVMKYLARIDSILLDVRRMLDAMPSRSVEFSQALSEYAENLDKEWKMTRLVMNMSTMDIDDELNKLLNQGK